MVKKKKFKTKLENLQIQDINISFRFIVVTILIILITLFFLNFLVNLPQKIEESGGISESAKVKESGEKVGKAETFFSSEGATKVKTYLPAVDNEGRGVNTVLKVEATHGSGRTLTDIDNLLFWADTQHSIRIARRVAENITNKNEEDYDIIYTIEANASLIGGPSAGAALAIATIAVLEDKKLKENVMITGSINHDGSIGPVSAILEKAKAAKKIGATLLLVPLLQSRDVVYETAEHCEKFGNTQICTTETKPKKIEVEKEANITIREVENVRDAMQYFFE